MVRRAKYFSRLFRVCQARGRSPEDSEDLIQEAFLRLEEYQDKAEVRDPKSFLIKVVTNLATDHSRRERVRMTVQEPIEELPAHLPLVDFNPTPERVLDGEQRLNAIIRVLDTVGRRTREMFLAQHAGYEHAEIAKAFGVSDRTVEREIHKAVYALMKAKIRPQR